MCNFVAIKNTKIKSLCKPLEIEFKKNFFLCKLLRAVTTFKRHGLLVGILDKYNYLFSIIIFEIFREKSAIFFQHSRAEHEPNA